MLGPAFRRCVQPWLLAAVVGLYCVGQQPAAERRRTKKPPYLHLLHGLGDFDGMLQRRQIRLIVPYSKTKIFFIDKGDQWGTAAEWGDELDKWLNKGKKSQLDHIQIDFVPTPRAELITALNEGRGDVVLANLTITNDLLAKVDFTDPALKNVREILVTGPSARAIGKVEDLSGEKLHVRKSSSYFEHLIALNEWFASQGLKGIELIPAGEDLEDEDLLEMVNAGFFPSPLWTTTLRRSGRRCLNPSRFVPTSSLTTRVRLQAQSAKTVHCSRQRLIASFRKKPQKTLSRMAPIPLLHER